MTELNRRALLWVQVAAAVVAGFGVAAIAQPAQSMLPSVHADVPTKPAKLKRLSDGQPDVQGTWTAVFYGMGCLTNPTNGDVNCVPPPGPRPAAGTANAGGPPPPDASGHTLGQRGNGNPPEAVDVKLAAGGGDTNSGQRQRRDDGQATAPGGGVYAADGTPTVAQPARAARRPRAPRNAPSRIVDTEDHDIPYTSQAAAHQKDLFAHYYAPTRYGDIDPQQRCWPLGAVRQFTWHDVTIEQFPGYVLFLYSGAEQYRIVYLDNRPHIGDGLKLWFGDSRGHWEGNTLVVDTTSNNAKGRLSRAGDFSSDTVHYKEKFIFKDADHLRYEAVFDDPSAYTRPWTFAVDEKRGYFGGDGGVPEGPITAESQAKFEMWEEACHEGLIPGGNDIPGLSPIN